MTEEQGRCELAIIGAGVVGCALARRLGRGLGGAGSRLGAPARPCPGSAVLVIEGAGREGTGISSRNSGVVHAGLYYPPGSRKARSCVVGNAMLWDWVAAREVPHRRTGKLVVTTEPVQDEALERLLANAEASGAALERLTLAQARALEPNLPATIRAACWSPRSGIVDAHALVRSLLVDAEDAGVEFVFSAAVDRISKTDDGFAISTSRGPVIARRVINAAGLGAVCIANQLGLSRRMVPARGDYFRLRTRARWQRLIYPVVTPGSPALGIHLTLELDGGCRLGPDLEYPSVDGRPGGSQVRAAEWFDAPPNHLLEAKQNKFLAAARTLLGPVAFDDLSYDGCGIRPKLVGPGEPAADFELVEHPRGAWHLLGIESPGLTAALALADELAELVTASAWP